MKKISQILITSNTLSSSKILSNLKLKKTIHQFFPIDTNYHTKKFLDYWKPSVAIFIDSEIWPNMITNIKKVNKEKKGFFVSKHTGQLASMNNFLAFFARNNFLHSGHSARRSIFDPRAIVITTSTIINPCFKRLNSRIHIVLLNIDKPHKLMYHRSLIF